MPSVRNPFATCYVGNIVGFSDDLKLDDLR
jgi:hypothetical protein